MIVPVPRVACKKLPNGPIFLTCCGTKTSPGAAMSWPCRSVRPCLSFIIALIFLEKLNRKPPQTWAEYQELAKLLSGMKQSTAESPWFGTAEPLGPGWAGLVLLARAAPYAKHRDNYSTLFNIKTMEPLLTGPPMVRALEELVAAAKLGPPEALQSDPAAIRAGLLAGKMRHGDHVALGCRQTFQRTSRHCRTIPNSGWFFRAAGLEQSL